MKIDRQLPTALLLSLALGFSLAATEARAETFVVTEPWVRAADDGRSAEGYMKLTSSEGTTLLSVTSFAAARVSICQPGQVCHKLKELDLPAGQLVQLAPASYRIRLQGLTRKLKLGARVSIALTIRHADGREQEIPIDAEVRLHSPTADEADPHHRHDENSETGEHHHDEHTH